MKNYDEKETLELKPKRTADVIIDNLSDLAKAQEYFQVPRLLCDECVLLSKDEWSRVFTKLQIERKSF